MSKDEGLKPLLGVKSIIMTLPHVDENGTPITKMPYCPRCSEDELSMLNGQAFCNYCCLVIYPADSRPPSLDVEKVVEGLDTFELETEEGEAFTLGHAIGEYCTKQLADWLRQTLTGVGK